MRGRVERREGRGERGGVAVERGVGGEAIAGRLQERGSSRGVPGRGRGMGSMCARWPAARVSRLQQRTPTATSSSSAGATP